MPLPFHPPKKLRFGVLIKSLAPIHYTEYFNQKKIVSLLSQTLAKMQKLKQVIVRDAEYVLSVRASIYLF